MIERNRCGKPISEQQLEKLTSLDRDFKNKLRENYSRIRYGELTMTEHRKKVDEMAAERNKEIEQILSEAQKEKFTELKGRQFNFTKPAESE